MARVVSLRVWQMPQGRGVKITASENESSRAIDLFPGAVVPPEMPVLEVLERGLAALRRRQLPVHVGQLTLW